MAFDFNVFPLELSAQTARSGWNTTVVVLGGGGEQRNINWSDARRRYEASLPTLTLAQYRQIEKFFNARRSRGRSFPIIDRSIWTVTALAFGTGDGSTTAFQLKYDDGDAGNSYQREAYLPVQGTLQVFDNATPVVEGAGAGKFTAQYSGANGGQITFGTAPTTGHVLTATFNQYVPVRFDIDEMPDAQLFQWSTIGTGLVNGPSIPLIEVRYSSEF